MVGDQRDEVEIEPVKEPVELLALKVDIDGNSAEHVDELEIIERVHYKSHVLVENNEESENKEVNNYKGIHNVVH